MSKQSLNSRRYRSETRRLLPAPSSPELEPSPPPSWLCWPGDTRSGPEVSLWMLSSESETEERGKMETIQRFVCNERGQEY